MLKDANEDRGMGADTGADAESADVFRWSRDGMVD
jgi:hypothetical protein